MSKTDGKCTFSATPLVCIVIKGKPHPKGFPYCPDDDGLVARFLEWLLVQDFCTSVVGGGMSGGGMYSGFFRPEDAPKVLEWLRGQRVKETATLA